MYSSIIIIIASTKKRASFFWGQFFASGQNLQKGDLIFMDIYLQGLTMGLAYVAPIGLQNLFVINVVCGCVIIFYGLKLLRNFIQLVLPYLS